MNDELYDNILSWKEKYGSVYLFKIRNVDYIFRTLTRGEFFNMLSVQEIMGINSDEIVIKKCLLHPTYNPGEMDGNLAGDFDSLVNKIMELSGFFDGEKFLKDIEVERNKIKSLDSQVAILICKAFPQLTLEDVNNFNYQQILRYIAMSEDMLDIKLSVEKQEKTNNINFEKENAGVFGDNYDPRSRSPKMRGDAPTG